MNYYSQITTEQNGGSEDGFYNTCFFISIKNALEKNSAFERTSVTNLRNLAQFNFGNIMVNTDYHHSHILKLIDRLNEKYKCTFIIICHKNYVTIRHRNMRYPIIQNMFVEDGHANTLQVKYDDDMNPILFENIDQIKKYAKTFYQKDVYDSITDDDFHTSRFYIYGSIKSRNKYTPTETINMVNIGDAHFEYIKTITKVPYEVVLKSTNISKLQISEMLDDNIELYNKNIKLCEDNLFVERNSHALCQNNVDNLQNCYTIIIACKNILTEHNNKYIIKKRNIMNSNVFL